jgi:AcrR family transcriptional regulator
VPTRTRILAAARRLSRSGRRRPTLTEVARAAGVSRATVHRVIGSRAQLLSAIEIDPDPATRDRALAAALELVGEVGLTNLSMDGLAVRAGTSRANLYRLFPGKAALFRELVRTYAPLQPVREVLDRLGDRPPEEVMPELARRAAAHLEGRMGLVRTLFLEITGSGLVAGAGRELAMAEGVAAVAGYLVGQMQAGRLRLMNPVLALQMFVGPVMVHLLTRRVLAEFMGQPPPLEEAVTQLAEGWLRAMRTEA